MRYSDYEVVVRVVGSIDEASYREFSETPALDTKDTSVLVELNSDGGLAVQALAFVSRMRLAPQTIAVLGIGEVCSAATIILAAGTRGHRFLTKESWVMTHEDSGKIKGTVSQMESEVRTARRLEDQWCYLMGKYTRVSAKAWKKMNASGDVYLNPKECLTMGLIDEIV